VFMARSDFTSGFMRLLQLQRPEADRLSADH
jgi:hypothetical protein